MTFGTGKYLVICLLFLIYGVDISENSLHLDMKDVHADVSYIRGIGIRHFSNYRDLWIVEYAIPEDTVIAYLNITAFTNHGDKCAYSNITIQLQYGGFPLVNPNNASYPDRFYLERTSPSTEIICAGHSCNQTAGENVAFVTFASPRTGSWYAAAYLHEAHAHTVGQITEKSNDCQYFLMSNFTTLVAHNAVAVIDAKIGQHNFHKINMKQQTIFRFFVQLTVYSYTVTVQNCTVDAYSSECANLKMTVSQGSLSPLSDDAGNDDDDVSNSSIVCTNHSAVYHCSITVDQPLADAYHYVVIDTYDQTKKTLHVAVTLSACDVPNLGSIYPSTTIITTSGTSLDLLYSDKCDNINKLTRVTNPGFDFDVSFYVPLYPMYPKIYYFDILDVDIGGTLAVKSLMPIPPINVSLTTDPHFTVTLCIQRHRIPVVGSTVRCLRDLGVELKFTYPEDEGGNQTLYIPYPERGVWYMSVDLVCYTGSNHTDETPCEFKPFDGNHIDTSIDIQACVDNSCGEYGTCQEGKTAHFLYMTCKCKTGAQGFGCTDYTHRTSLHTQLTYTLLLTLSNLLFIPAVVLAIKRQFHTEALVYFCNMFFSSFYHACDAAAYSIYTKCILPYNVLSYSDFFCSIMSFWVTLIAVARLPSTHYKGFLHMLGVMVMSMVVLWKQHEYIPYIVPIAIGVLLILASWIARCYKRKKFVWLPRICVLFFPGLLLASTGLCIYAFLETDANYPYIHSVWHACMSLCVLFFLPSRRVKPGETSAFNSLLVLDDVLDVNSSDDSVNLLPTHRYASYSNDDDQLLDDEDDQPIWNNDEDSSTNAGVHDASRLNIGGYDEQLLAT